jgi:hypothetical protein
MKCKNQYTNSYLYENARKRRTEIMKEQMTEDGKKGGKIGGKNVASQKWMCLETGHISTPAGLAIFQNKRGIDTSKRKRIE